MEVLVNKEMERSQSTQESRDKVANMVWGIRAGFSVLLFKWDLKNSKAEPVKAEEERRVFQIQEAMSSDSWHRLKDWLIGGTGSSSIGPERRGETRESSEVAALCPANVRWSLFCPWTWNDILFRHRNRPLGSRSFPPSFSAVWLFPLWNVVVLLRWLRLPGVCSTSGHILFSFSEYILILFH